MSYDAAQIKYVTRQFDNLQGLRLVPLGMFILLQVAGMVGWLPAFAQGQLGISGLTFLAVLFFYHLIGRYYQRHFGVVKKISTRREKVEKVLILTAFIGGVLVDVYWQPAISIFALMIALLYLYSYLSSAPMYRNYYLVIAGLFFVVSCLPLWLPASIEDAFLGSGGVVFYTVFGISVIISGILDHMLLLKTLPPLPEED